MEYIEGWVKAYRKMAEHPIWLEKPFSKGQAWFDLILRANHTPKKMMLGNEIIEIKRGQLHTSELKLSSRWGWSKKKVHSFLKLLEVEEMVTTHGTSKGTTITIEKYGDYQLMGTTKGSDWEPDGKRSGNGQEPDGKRSGNGQGAQIKNDKNDKKKKNEKKDKNIYGEFSNVRLTGEEYEKLVERFPLDYLERIEKLSLYVESTGKKYTSHYATILNWSRKDQPKEKPPSSQNPFLDERL